MQYIEADKVETNVMQRICIILSITIGILLTLYGFIKLGIFIGQLISPYFPIGLWWCLWITGVPLYILWGIGLGITSLIAYIMTGHEAGYYCIDGGQHNHDGYERGMEHSYSSTSWCTKCGKIHN